MPVLGALPEEPVIIALRGKLDFYLWRGIPCCRSWPRAPTEPRSPAVQASGAVFAAFSRELPFIGAPWYEAALQWTQGERWTWRDFVTTLAYGQNTDF